MLAADAFRCFLSFIFHADSADAAIMLSTPFSSLPLFLSIFDAMPFRRHCRAAAYASAISMIFFFFHRLTRRYAARCCAINDAAAERAS
jgi:small neutral amino acid transporter SnatA (MarC family)